METNNQLTINLNDDLLNLESSNVSQLPQEVIEEAEEIDAQSTESTTENAIVIAKKTKRGQQQISVKHIFQSLFYSMQWSQLKRQLNKEAFIGMAHRHWKKGLGGAAVLVLCSNLNFGGGPGTPATLNPYAGSQEMDMTTRSAAVVLVSEAAKENYIARFSGVAQGEMKKFGIPASVTLGLAILHSNYGASELAQQGHNHFHITCDDNHLAEGITGRGMEEGACHIHYQNAWTSFRANSLKLNAEHYQELKAIAGQDYQIWVSGLHKMGYPEADHLLPIIEQHQLYEFDQLEDEK